MTHPKRTRQTNHKQQRKIKKVVTARLWRTLPVLAVLLVFLLSSILNDSKTNTRSGGNLRSANSAMTSLTHTNFNTSQTEKVKAKGDKSKSTGESLGIDIPFVDESKIDLSNPLPTQDQLKAQELGAAIGRNISATEWLGPIAPISLSPFFGITCLSGMATYGSGWVGEGNAFLDTSSPLNNEGLFWTFFVLTILTSIPKLSKVSKPVAQIADLLETYSSIVTLVVLKFMMSEAAPETVEQVQQAGILSFSMDVLLTIAMIINVIVVNTVKFFFEMLIWITPIPFLDACFEVANKTICTVLLAIYAFSPLLATVINIALFVVCFFVFRWARRQSIYYRSMVLDIVLGMIWKDRGVPSKSELVVFPTQSVGDIKQKSLCKLVANGDQWRLEKKNLLTRPAIVEIDSNSKTSIERGLIMNTLSVDENEFHFSRRYNDNLETLAKMLGAEIVDRADESPESANPKMA